MGRVPLLGGAYQAKGVIASAQRCINLYPENNPQIDQAPAPVTHYQAPGLDLLITGGGSEPVRSLYRTSQGKLYAVIAGGIYYISPSYTKTLLGSLPTGFTPVSMQDNGLVITIVDGTPTGYVINMANDDFSIIKDSNFYGATKAAYLDTFMIFNRPNTSQFYITASNSTYAMFVTPAQIVVGTIVNAGSLYTDGVYTGVSLTGGSGSGAVGTITVAAGVVTNVTFTNFGINYELNDLLSANASDIGGTGSGFSYRIDEVSARALDALDIASKSGYPDNIQTIAVVQGYLWLIGVESSELWYNSEDSDFAFARLPGVNIIQHGTIAPYSVCAQDLFPYWISQDQQGQAIIMKGDNYQSKRISTHAIENELSTYPIISDCISFTYQQEGHVFIVFAFPTANKTWVYDEATAQWHERCWTDNNGILNRHRANCIANAYGKITVGDWQNGNIYAFNLDTFTDNGQPITWMRSFPHSVKDGNRVAYSQFIADMAVGNDDGSIDGSDGTNPPLVFLRWSDNRGVSYGNPISQSLGATGEYLTSVQFQRLGIARDRVFEIFWSAPCKTSLQGAWIKGEEAET